MCWGVGGDGQQIGWEDLGDPLEMGAEQEERLQQVVCCRAEDEIEGLSLDEWRER